MLAVVGAVATVPIFRPLIGMDKDEITAELKAKPTTRAQDIMAKVPDYWAHYEEQAASDQPELDPRRSRR